jgi:hypothetical protein
MRTKSWEDTNSPIEKHFFMRSRIFWGHWNSDIGRRLSQLDGEIPPW